MDIAQIIKLFKLIDQIFLWKLHPPAPVLLRPVIRA